MATKKNNNLKEISLLGLFSIHILLLQSELPAIFLSQMGERRLAVDKIYGQSFNGRI
jgi:hypothetical protein